MSGLRHSTGWDRGHDATCHSQTTRAQRAGTVDTAHTTSRHGSHLGVGILATPGRVVKRRRIPRTPWIRRVTAGSWMVASSSAPASSVRTRMLRPAQAMTAPESRIRRCGRTCAFPWRVRAMLNEHGRARWPARGRTRRPSRRREPGPLVLQLDAECVVDGAPRAGLSNTPGNRRCADVRPDARRARARRQAPIL